MPTRFTELPRELRDLVYHHLWQSKPRLDFEGRREDIFYAKYTPQPVARRSDQHRDRDERSLPTGLPQWLRTSKMILEEGLEAFNRNAEIVLCSKYVPDEFESEDSDSDESGVWDWEVRRYGTGKFPALLHPARSRNLFIEITADDNWGYDSPEPWMKWEESELSFCEALFDDVSKESTLKELRLHIMADMFCSGVVHSYSMALAPLQLLLCTAVRSLDRLEAYIELGTSYRHNKDFGSLESMLLVEVDKLNCGILQSFICSAVGDMTGARVFQDGRFNGWKLEWARA